MNKEQKKGYQDDGYIVLKNVIPSKKINELIGITNNIIQNSQLIEKYNYLFDYENSHGHNRPKVLRRIKTPEKINKMYYEIAKDKCVISHISDILGENIRLEGIKINIKHSHYGSEVLWHQDWAFQAYTNDKVLTVCVLLDEVSEKNSPIHVIPGSHKSRIYPHDSLEGFTGSINLKNEDLPTETAIPLLGSIGDVTLHHYRILHCSPENRSPYSRKILFLRYAAANAWPLMGILDYKEGFSFEKMKDRIVLGEQTIEPILQNVPVRMPLPYPKSFDKLPSELRSYGILEAFSEK